MVDFAGLTDMKIAAILAVAPRLFPLWNKAIESIVDQADAIHVWLDQDTEPSIEPILAAADIKVIRADEPYSSGGWREKLIRSLDDVKPDVVLQPDHDETFEPTIHQELTEFLASNKDAIMFSYRAPMPTCDNRVVFKGRAYPPAPHMLGFRWKPGLTFRPYCGYCQVTNYANNPAIVWKARTKVLHYCMWTPEMEAKKTAHIFATYPDMRPYVDPNPNYTGRLPYD